MKQGTGIFVSLYPVFAQPGDAVTVLWDLESTGHSGFVLFR